MRHLLFLSVLLVVFSCSRNELTDDTPITPNEVEIDVNDNGNTDYYIKFRFVDIESANSSFGITGSIDPSDNNQVLTKLDHKNLFLRDLDLIKEVVEDPLKWSTKGFSKEILSISNNTEGQWPNNWEINADSNRSSYFIGVKIENDNVIELGWIELEIDRSTGKVILIDKNIL